ncbi:MAG: hypothetical protein ACXWTS_02105 [Methylococcaceae bacterium]
MKNYRLFLLSFLTVTYVFLSGFKAADANVPASEQQKMVNKIKQQSDDTLTKSRPQESKLKPSSVTVKESEADSKYELQKPLDLSIPFKDLKNTEQKIEQHTQVQSAETNIFAPDTQKKPQQLQLNGQLLKSPDPEVEKQKSVDGAGIVINLKP